MMNMSNRPLICFACVFTFVLSCHGVGFAEDQDTKIKVLLIDGQNNHNWRETTPVIKQTLEACGKFSVDVVTAPEQGGDMSKFQPDFSRYDVVVSNYNGESWSDATQKSFEQFVAGGKGFVSVHAADNSFPKWNAYNQMIGLGGWGGRNQTDGPYVRWKEDQKRFTRDVSKGNGGAHGKRVPFVVVVRDQDHPVTRGLPGTFMQTADELYSKLRGPAVNMHVLATGFSNPETGGSGEHEPLLMTIQFGQGRVFHTTLGHDVEAMTGVAFQVTLQRGTQWAATGDVTLPDVDAKTVESDKASQRDPADAAYDGKMSATSLAVMPNIDEKNWISLFNESDLTGWSPKNGTATYRVEDGSIVGKTAEGSPNSFLCTDKIYTDFELTFEVMDDPGLNSGVQIRSESKAEFMNGRVHGPQVEIEAAPGESGYIYSEGTGREWITKERPIDDAFKNGQWNRYVVRAIGDRYQTWINGIPIADVLDPVSGHEGFIGLQVHSIGNGTAPMQVRWRDLRIREL